mmetsp:Transcript_25503/g.60328  ORF Transcript_25503/g.60328 Transcript_25503/m.60328 type:complete len:209 (+) Transcript_25503:382-1008(+)|eukprot:CAMPEP_0113465308 /NCGR_PEP_ID=MMETSP0014_2-20120614/13668_1 /TAXON_ID=2857 /ORGANISM="Nitzschia sp." /LENGTH=208 /DNA_ID=CAMNT_0000357453 /DNA_START=229 /DNA_END=855 /DNA_ORIENTATION=+ /assembly_acc=CAM_ASM_000159
MGLVGLVAELVVLGCCIAAVVTNSLLLTSCELLKLGGVTRDGSIGLFYADFPNPNVAGEECTNIDNVEGSDQLKDAAFNCARYCAILAFVFGAILLVFGVFKQCICPLPCTQLLMDVSGTFVQIMLALVYVIWLTEACNQYYCTYGQGGTYLVLTQIFWLGASCFTRCMRPGRYERRDEIAAAKQKKKQQQQEEKERKEAEQAQEEEA